VATFDRFGNKKEAGRERGEGDKNRGVKNIEGEKRKVGGGKVYEGDKLVIFILYFKFFNYVIHLIYRTSTLHETIIS